MWLKASSRLCRFFVFFAFWSLTSTSLTSAEQAYSEPASLGAAFVDAFKSRDKQAIQRLLASEDELMWVLQKHGVTASDAPEEAKRITLKHQRGLDSLMEILAHPDARISVRKGQLAVAQLTDLAFKNVQTMGSADSRQERTYGLTLSRDVIVVATVNGAELWLTEFDLLVEVKPGTWKIVAW